MTVPLYLETVPNAQPLINQIAATLPHIETERLILRVPTLADWPVLEPIFTTDRAKYIGGPMGPEDAWLDYCQMIAGWILRGFGSLTIEHGKSGDVLGIIFLEHENGDPEPELGWLLTEAAEGNGYAIEAANALHTYAMPLFGDGNFVSYIDKNNTGSIRIAEKLGAKLDAKPHPGFTDGLVYRHHTPETPK